MGLLLGVFCRPAIGAGPAVVAAIRFGQEGDRTRIVLDLGAMVPFRCGFAPDGRTLTVTLDGVDWRPPRTRTLHDGGPLAGYDFAAGRVTVRADRRLRLVSAVALSPEPHLPVHRIVIDLVPDPEPGAAAAPAPEAKALEISGAKAADAPAPALERGVRAALGRDGPPDFAAAAEAFRSAALAGSPQAAFDLGELYRAGKGVPQDYGQAAAWFVRAASAGFAPAQFYLAVLVFNGAGVARDRLRATGLLEQAAAQGLPEARQALEELHHADQAMAEHRPN